MQFRKYEFNTPAEWASLKSSHIQLAKNGTTQNASVVELGNIILVPGTYDDMGQELTPPTRSTKTAVDILWYDNIIPSAFTQYEVWPAGVGNHSFSGLEGLYKEEYNKRNQ